MFGAESEGERKVHQASVVTVMSDQQICKLSGNVPAAVKTAVVTGAGATAITTTTTIVPFGGRKSVVTAAEGQDIGHQEKEDKAEKGGDRQGDEDKEDEENDVSARIAALRVKFNAQLEQVQADLNRELGYIEHCYLAKIRAANDQLSTALVEKKIAETRAQDAQKLLEVSKRGNDQPKAVVGQTQQTRAPSVCTTPEGRLGRIMRVVSASTWTSKSTSPDLISRSLAGVDGLHTLTHKEVEFGRGMC